MIFIPKNKCPVCGKPKAANAHSKVANHRKCSRVLQAQFAEENQARAEKRARIERRYGRA